MISQIYSIKTCMYSMLINMLRVSNVLKDDNYVDFQCRSSIYIVSQIYISKTCTLDNLKDKIKYKHDSDFPFHTFG